MKPWIQTYCGQAAWPLQLMPEQVRLHDIAHHLANLCRFTGAPRRFYSVAEHSVHVSRRVSPEHALAALMHDAAEAYLGDCTAPLKHLTYFRCGNEYVTFKGVEQWAHAVICAALHLPGGIPAQVKEVDLKMLQTERLALLSPPPLSWELDVLSYDPALIQGWAPEIAEVKFLQRWEELRR